MHPAVQRFLDQFHEENFKLLLIRASLLHGTVILVHKAVGRQASHLKIRYAHKEKFKRTIRIRKLVVWRCGIVND